MSRDADAPELTGSGRVSWKAMLGGASSMTLFHIRGIRISVDWSWFLVLFLIIVFLSGFYRDILGDPDAVLVPYALALASALGFFGSIVLHELGHAFAALRHGIGITGIQLWIFGGVAQLKRDSDSPKAELQVAIAGPLVTFAIVVVLVLVTLVAVGPTDLGNALLIRSGATSSGILALIAWLATINLLVLVFNLLPAFPMDGGRVIRALAWSRTGDRAKATRFAAKLGQGFAYIFVAGGILLLFTGLIITGVWLILIGFIINGSARAAAMQTRVSGRIEGITVGDVMDTEPVTIPAETSVESALDEYFLRYRWQWFAIVDEAGEFRGILQRERADEIPEPERARTRVEDLIESGSQRELRISEEAPLDSLLGNAELHRLGALFAIDANGRLKGVITADQVGRALRDPLAR